MVYSTALQGPSVVWPFTSALSPTHAGLRWRLSSIDRSFDRLPLRRHVTRLGSFVEKTRASLSHASGSAPLLIMARSIDGESCFGACAEEFSPCRFAAIPRGAKFIVTVSARRFACPRCGSAVFSAVE